MSIGGIRFCVHKYSGAPEFTFGFWWGSCYSIFSFMCMFCESFFVLLFFFFQPLWCLFFDLRILITLLISSNSSSSIHSSYGLQIYNPKVGDTRYWFLCSSQFCLNIVNVCARTIDVRENRKDNKKWTIQSHRQRRAKRENTAQKTIYALKLYHG